MAEKTELIHELMHAMGVVLQKRTLTFDKSKGLFEAREERVTRVATRGATVWIRFLVNLAETVEGKDFGDLEERFAVEWAKSYVKTYREDVFARISAELGAPSPADGLSGAIRTGSVITVGLDQIRHASSTIGGEIGERYTKFWDRALSEK